MAQLMRQMLTVQCCASEMGTYSPFPIPTQPEAMVAQSTSSSERALKVHTLSQICWFHCYIPQGRQSIDAEPKNKRK